MEDDMHHCIKFTQILRVIEVPKCLCAVCVIKSECSARGLSKSQNDKAQSILSDR